MSEIVNLRGETLPDRREPDEAVVTAARNLLELAESGELRGVIMAGLYADDATYGMRAGTLTFSVIGRLQALMSRTVKDLDDV